MDDWLSAGATLLGGLLGSQDKGATNTTTQQNTLDPRVTPYIYGDANTQGVLPNVANWYQQNQSGLNAQSLAGLNRQYAVASDPSTAQGYTDMQSLGSRLMGGGVVGNPFSDGRASLGGSSMAAPGTSISPGMAATTFTNPANSQNPAFSQQTFSARPLNTGASSTPVAGVSIGLSGLLGQGNYGSGLLSSSSGGSNSFGGINGNGMPGEGGGFTSEDAIGYAMNNPGTVSSIAGGLLGPTGSLLSRLITSAMGYGAAPNTGQINNFGNRNDARQNAAIGASMNQYGGGGGNASGAGGDSSRGSQSSNGGRNGGDSGGF